MAGQTPTPNQPGYPQQPPSIPQQQGQTYPQQAYQQAPQQPQYQQPQGAQQVPYQQGYPQQYQQAPQQPQYQQMPQQAQYQQAPQQYPQAYPQQYAQPYPQQMAAPAPAKPAPNIWGIAALACGALGVVASPTLVGGAILGIVAIALGVIGILKPRRGLAIAGTAAGVVAVGASVAMLILGWSIFGQFRLVPVSRDAPDTEATVATVRESVSDRLNVKPFEVADDNRCFIEIERVSFDSEGNLVIYTNMTLKNDADYLWLDAPPMTWTVNDTAVEPVLNTALYLGDFDRENCFFYIPADQLEGIGGLDTIYSIRGTIRCTSYVDGESTDSVQYDVAL